VTSGFGGSASYPCFKAFKALDMSTLDDTKIAQASQLVFKLYQELGGNNKVAKGPELLERIRIKITE